MSEKKENQMSLVYIMDILKKYSDADHTLGREDVIKYLAEDYDIALNSKTVGNNLRLLKNYCEKVYDFDLDCKEVAAKNGVKYTDWYAIREFTNGEIEMLEDCVLASKNLSETYRNDLLEKLSHLGRSDDKSERAAGSSRLHPDNIKRSDDGRNVAENLFYMIEQLREAIDQGKKVGITYKPVKYSQWQHFVDPEDKITEDGLERYREVLPYQLVVSGENYYLIGRLSMNHMVFDFSHYRLGDFKEVEILESHDKPLEKFSDEEKMELETYLYTHPDMVYGSPMEIKFMLSNPDECLEHAIEYFGSALCVTDEHRVGGGFVDYVVCEVETVPRAIINFAKSFGPYVQVLSPECISESVILELANTLKLYGGEEAAENILIKRKKAAEAERIKRRKAEAERIKKEIRRKYGVY